MMRALHFTSAALVGLVAVTLALAGGQAVGIEAAQGAVDKAEKDSLTVQTRNAAGQFGKKLVLKLTGTSKLSSVGLEKRAGKLVPVQKDIDAQDLEPGQAIAVIYSGGGEPVLLAAVVQRGAKK